VPSALVTGANGFVGSHLCDRLLERGYEVLALVRRTSDLRWLDRSRIRLCYGDVTEPDSLVEPASRCDYVFHGAAIIKAWNLAGYERVNLGGTRNLLNEALKRAPKVKRFVLMSTVAAGGPHNGQCSPVSDYGRSKLAAERLVQEHADRLPVAILRLPPVYGPRDHEFLQLYKVIKAGWEPSVPLVMNYCYVADAVDAAIALAESDAVRPEPCAVSDGRPYAFAEWAGTVARILGRRTRKIPVPLRLARMLAWIGEKLAAEMPSLNRDKLREVETGNWTCTGDALQACTGFRARYDLEQGMRLTLAWYQAEGLL
jgi:nucleoside-diphosphate-sugar epimerase